MGSSDGLDPVGNRNTIPHLTRQYPGIIPIEIHKLIFRKCPLEILMYVVTKYECGQILLQLSPSGSSFNCT